MFDVGPTLIVQILNFVVLLFILRMVLYRPLLEILNQRKETIESQVKEAEMINQEARDLREQYQQKIADAHKEAQKIIQDASVYADRMREELLLRAKEEANRIVLLAQKDVEQEKSKAFSEVRTHLAGLAVSIAGKVLEESLDPSVHEALVKDFIKKVGGHVH